MLWHTNSRSTTYHNSRSTHNNTPHIDISALERLAAALAGLPVKIAVQIGHSVAAIAAGELADVRANEAARYLATGRAEAGGHTALSFAETRVELRELYGVHFAVKGKFGHGRHWRRAGQRCLSRSLCLTKSISCHILRHS